MSIHPKKKLNHLAAKAQAPTTEKLNKLEREIDLLHKLIKDTRQELIVEQNKHSEQLVAALSNRSSYRLSDTEIIAKIFTGAKFYLDPSDKTFTPIILLDNEWEHDITHAWLRCIRPGYTVLDIGANFGYFGILAAQQATRDCNVFLFEANPDIVPYLKKTIKENGFQDCIKIENSAVGEKTGKAELTITEGFVGSSSLHSIDEINTFNDVQQDFQAASSIAVPMITVDNFSKKEGLDSINLIKMDIEGYEDKAYAGMRSMIQQSEEVTLFVEFTTNGYKNPREFYNQMLEDFTYVYTISPDGSLNKCVKKDYDSVIGATGGWVMPVFSKRSDLAS